MSPFTFKGDIKNLTQKQLEVIRQALEKLKFKGCDVPVESFGKVGDNYASDVKIIRMKTTDKETFNIIVKINPHLGYENAAKNVNCVLFNNEITIYTEVLPMMVDLQKASGVPEEEIMKFPSCYGSSREEGHEIMLLEDLTQEQYTMLNRFDPLSSDTVKLVLRNLARFHSLSYALRNKHPEIFSNLLRKLTDLNNIKEVEEQHKSISLLGEAISIYFEKQKHKNNVITILRDHKSNIKKIMDSDNGTKYTVILHGDSWTNNILFKLKDGIPKECIMIDYQLARECLPVADILYLIFNCTDYKTRSEHFHDWIDFYHTELENNLFNYGLKAANVYPREKLDSDLKRYAKTYIGVAMVVLSVLMREASESALVKEAMASTDADGVSNFLKISHLQEDTLFKIKLKFEEIIDTGIDFGYLNSNPH